MLKKTWGQQLMGGLAFGLIYFLFSLLGFGIMAGAGYLYAVTGNMVVLGLGVAVTLAYFILLVLISSAQTPIFQAALYVYAKEGHAPGSFGEGLLKNAFRSKK
jgi:hypothetical protein